MAHTLYSNFVLENKVENFLSTAIDMTKYATIDYSLTEAAGMTKTVDIYTATGNVEDLAMGAGNTSTNDITVAFTPHSYTVQTTQGHLPVYDEEQEKDPMVLEVGLQKLSDQMTNDLTSKIVAELNTATLTQTMTDWGFNDFVDAISKYPYENEEGLFILINPAELAKVRKALGDNLKYSEGFARTGYVGHICGVPIVVSKAITAGTGILADNKACTVFVKKGVEMEQQRNANTRLTDYYARKCMVVALTDATRAIKLA